MGEQGAGMPGVLPAGELALWEPDIVAKLGRGGVAGEAGRLR